MCITKSTKRTRTYSSSLCSRPGSRRSFRDRSAVTMASRTSSTQRDPLIREGSGQAFTGCCGVISRKWSLRRDARSSSMKSFKDMMPTPTAVSRFSSVFCSTESRCTAISRAVSTSSSVSQNCSVSNLQRTSSSRTWRRTSLNSGRDGI